MYKLSCDIRKFPDIRKLHLINERHTLDTRLVNNKKKISKIDTIFLTKLSEINQTIDMQSCNQPNAKTNCSGDFICNTIAW